MEQPADLSSPRINGVLSAFIILMVALAGFIVVGPLIGFAISLPFFTGSLIDFTTALQQPQDHPEIKIPYFILQGSATLFGLVVIPALWWRFRLGQVVKDWFRPAPPVAWNLAIVALLTIIFMATNSVFAEWNADLHLPDAWKGIEDWIRSREELAMRLTQFFTTFSTPAEFIIAFVVIALLPAVGEEIVFRGMIQKELSRSVSPHVAIWISAILFSAIHFQFFGFVPRLLLGALFGYLYYWSGSLLLAMFAHFVNNGFIVIMLYFYQRGQVDIDPNSTEALPVMVVVPATLFVAVLLLQFKRQQAWQPS
ncbi:MAG: lysostaphin resistance A-like protein [Cyclobacteriaceae bacterium]